MLKLVLAEVYGATVGKDEGWKMSGLPAYRRSYMKSAFTEPPSWKKPFNAGSIGTLSTRSTEVSFCGAVGRAAIRLSAFCAAGCATCGAGEGTAVPPGS